MCLACIHNPMDNIDRMDDLYKILKDTSRDHLARRLRQLQAAKIKEFFRIIDNTTMCSGGMEILKRADEKRWELAKEI